MTPEEEDMLQLFIDESREHLENIEEDFLTIEQAGENYPEELINKTFRDVHTIKGSSALFPFKNITTLSHEIENVLGKIREKELKPNSEIITVLLEGADLLKSMINNTGQSGNVDISKVVAQLKAFLTNATNVSNVDNIANDTKQKNINSISNVSNNTNASRTALQESDQDGIPVLNDKGEQITFLKYAKMQEAQNAEHGGNFIYKIKLDLGNDTIESKRNADIILTACKDYCAVIDFFDRYISDNCYYIICATFMENDMFTEIVGLPQGSVSLVWSGTVKQSESEVNVTNEMSNSIAPEKKQFDLGSLQKVSEKASSEPKNQSQHGLLNAVQDKSATSLRVKVTVIDKLIGLASELVLTRNQLVQNVNNQSKAELSLITKKLNRVTSSLQKVIMSSRLQPVSSIYNKFKRLVRDTAVSMGKEIEAYVEGEDVEVDGSVLEFFSDSLVHLVRNAVDHGIESPETRVRIGKQAKGFIKLKTYHEAGQVAVEFEDDGAGIDLEKIGEQAVKKGFITEEQLLEMTEKDLLKMVSRPGISTAKKISSVSGRGVGMDFIHNSVSKFGGTMNIKTTLGKGTTISIKLPITIAIMPGVIVSVEDENFIIPQVNVVEIIRITPESVLGGIESVGNATAIKLRNELLPIARVSDILNIPRYFIDLKTEERKRDRRKNIADRRYREKSVSENLERRTSQERRQKNRQAINVVIVTTGEYKFGLIVSSVQNSAEIVIKPLGAHLVECREYAGATILANGKVSLILNISGIRDVLDLKEPNVKTKNIYNKQEILPKEFTDSQTFLIIRSCSDDLFAVSLGIISRIEKIKVSSMSTNVGKVAVPYHNGSLPLICIEDIIGGEKKLEGPTVYVMIFVAGGREIGILANDIIDTIEYNGIIDDRTYVQCGIHGSIVVNEKIILMLDLFTIAYKGIPDIFNKRNELFSATQGKKRILIVDDSIFFLKQITAFLEDANYEVLTAEDGIKGLAILNNLSEQVDLILTDIEMPNMDGLQFTQAIRENKKYKNLPVIAITSVVEEKAVKRGLDIGIDKYLVKLDRERVLKTCEYFISNGRVDKT